MMTDAWVVLEDAPTQMVVRQVRLSVDRPTPVPLSLGPIHDASIQVEGTFGAGSVEVSVSNSGAGYVPLPQMRHADLTAVPCAGWLRVAALDADEFTDLLVTVAGRR